jgi:hypothetical protein
MKLYRVIVYDNVKRNTCLNCRTDFKHRTELTDGYFPYDIFDLLSVYVPFLHLCHKLERSNALFQNSAKSTFINEIPLQFWFDMEVENFYVDTKFSNTHSVLSYHCVITDVD